MCVMSIFALAFYAYVVQSSLIFHRVKQRSPVWFYLSWIPGVGWFSLLVLALLKPRGGCTQCGWHPEGRFAAHCPECGWDLAKSFYEEAPLGPGERRIPFWLGHTMAGIILGFLMTVLGILSLNPVLQTWDRWEFKVVKARLVADPRMQQALGSPLQFGYPKLSSGWEQRTVSATASVDVQGPKGKGHLEAAFESCFLHGWHFTTLVLEQASGGRIALADDHPEGRKVPPRGGCLALTQTERDEVTGATMARLYRDPVLLTHVSDPLVFRRVPALVPTDAGGWDIRAEFLHGGGLARVTGRLLDPDAMVFSDLRLDLGPDHPPIGLSRDPALSARPSAWKTFAHRLGPNLKAYTAENFGEVLIAGLFVLMAGFGGWTYHRIHRNRARKTG